ncbi:MAG TPA: ABC transporter permease, partial [bacterium]|nr:ABC transporter permease [bacterium]
MSGWVGAGVLATLLLVAAVPRLFTREDPQGGDIITRLAPPSAAHALGTDHLGRDLLARLVHGARSS